MVTNNEAARKLKFMSSSRRIIFEEYRYELLKNSNKRVVGGAFPAFFDFSDCKHQHKKEKKRNMKRKSLIVF